MIRAHRAALALTLGSSVLLAVSPTGAEPAPGNSPPVCGPSLQVVECNGQGSPTIHVLDIGATDPDGDPITYNWALAGSCLLGQGTIDDPTLANPTLRFNMNGTCNAECGGTKVRISDGINPDVICKHALIIQDTTPPTATCPPDVMELWTTGPPTQTSEAQQGSATGSDNCDPSPTVTTIGETNVEEFGGGIEWTTTRTWEVMDCQGLTDQCTQTIVLVGQSYFNGTSATIDLDTSSCPNAISPTGTGVVQAVVFGSTDFDVAKLRPRSFQLRRQDGQGGPVSPISVLYDDGGAPVPGSVCHSGVADGFADLILVFDQAALSAALGLPNEPAKQFVPVELTGKTWSGGPFLGRDFIEVVP